MKIVNAYRLNATFRCFRLFMIPFLSFLLYSCKKEGPPTIDNYYKIGIIEGEYLNKSNNPTISTNRLFVSPAVKLQNSDVRGEIINRRAKLSFRNVRFYDELGTYTIENLREDIMVEDYRDGKWVRSVESFVSSGKEQKLGIVLVIDNSSSLSDKIADVRVAALRLVDILRTTFPEGAIQVGLVVFSRDISLFPPSSDLNLVQNRISNITNGEAATNLYTAVNKGLDMVHELDNSAFNPDGVALVSFTDGVNEGGEVSLSQLTSSLRRQTRAGGAVPSYVVAYEGGNGVEPKLSSIAANGGFFQKTPDSSTLIKIFENIANKVSAVYAVTYDRNDLTVTQPIKFRVRFKLKLF